MKKYLLTMVLAPLFSVSAATETVDGITWTYLPMVDGTAKIDAGSPYVRVIDISTKGAISIPATLGGRPVTSIGRSVFYGCSELTVVTIPSSVTSIGSSAFGGCSELNVVNVMYCDQGDIDSVKGLYAWPSRVSFVGMLPDPIFVPESGAVFDGSLKVSITNAVAGAAIYYTTDGSMPTSESPVYEGPFAIDDTTTVCAIAAEHPDYFDSEIVTRTFVRKWEVVKTPVLQSYYGSVQSCTPTTELRGSYLSVVMSCETEGAVIHFTTNGTVPTAESPVYEEPFKAFDTMTIRAIAVKDDWKDSSVAEIHVTKFWTIGDSLNLPDQGFTMGASGIGQPIMMFRMTELRP